MQSTLTRTTENFINLYRGKLDMEVQNALIGMGGVPRPKAEADTNLRKGMEKHFKDRKQASDFVDDVYKALTRRHGQNAIPQNVKEECFRQYRRHLWLGIERRQDELVDRLTAGQVNLMGGPRYPKPANLPDPIGWAMSNNGPGDVLVDTAGCPIHRFKLPPQLRRLHGPHAPAGRSGYGEWEGATA